METCNEILGSQKSSKIRSYTDVLNDNSLQRRPGYIKFDYFTDFLDVDIREMEHIPVNTNNDNFYTITTLNEEYIKQTYLNFICFISLSDFSEKFNKIYLERQDHFKLYFKYLSTLGPTYKPMDKDQLRNIIKIYSKYAPTFYRSLNWIDTSEMKDMSYLFEAIRTYFYLDISQWDVSNVRDMRGMFHESSINVDVSKWKLHPLVKVNKKTFGYCEIHKVYQFETLPPYYKRFCKYYTKKYSKIIYKQLRMFFNYE
jgi:hypothetical protein